MLYLCAISIITGYVTSNEPTFVYNKRCLGLLTEIRAYITLYGLDQLLPRRIKDLRGKNISNKRKISKILRFVRAEIVPTEDENGGDFWQTPRETLLFKTGDCEDVAILFQAICEWVGVPDTFVILGVIHKTVHPMYSCGHAWIVHGEKIIDPMIVGYQMAYFDYHEVVRLDSRWYYVNRPGSDSSD